jgi:NAD(P)-dependent dehydrogenase (short-subunit alcohol dehydrogenase family)
MAELEGKTALVTGASRGIERATATALAASGAHVLVLYGRSAQDAKSLVADIRSKGGRADAIQTDLGTPDGATLLAKEARSIVGERLDVLVSNAGISKAATIKEAVRDYSTGELKHNVVALAKAAKALKLPIIVTTTARDSMWGPTFPELVEALPDVEIIDRSPVNAFDDARVANAIAATGRKKLIFAGISLEVCAALPAITAVSKGLDAYVAVDASGTFSETKRQAGILRMLQAGVISL